MPIQLTQAEKKIARQLAEIKKNSGSHSPSPAMLAGIKGVTMRHDFCYLSNPHATELFLKHARRDFADHPKLRRIVEYYPSQNRALAEKLARFLNATHPLSISPPSHHPVTEDGDTPPRAGGEGERVEAKNIFVGNGATEIIQAVLQNFCKKKLLVPAPTFSPYREFIPKGARVIHHLLQKEDNFKLDLTKLLADVSRERPDTVVIINPNNPDGGYHFANELQSLLANLRHIPTVIIDESFLHFAEDADKRRLKSADARRFPDVESVAPFVGKYPNLIVIKSFSKDFGIAGLRLGYALLNERRVTALLKRGYLWNVSGFGEYFLELLNRKDFVREYEQARLRAIQERDEFFAALSKINGLRVYPSMANMFLVELTDGSNAPDFVVALLVRHGIYVRLCKDKSGLCGEFVRIASRSGAENRRVINALRAVLSA